MLFNNYSYLCSRYNIINSYSYSNGTIWNFRNVFRFNIYYFRYCLVCMLYRPFL